MAKKSSIEKNELKKRTVAKYAARRAELKKTIQSAKTSYEEREEAWKALRKMPRNASRTRVRNRCMTTGRPRGFYRKFGLCRLELRLRAMRGELPGVTKSSW